ncbi:hypothetical protein ACFELC_23520 [Pseudomonas aeruginosa]|uniref:hypothetical protein n=1 Tax=Pseudomonas aeruginosa TaxID=287 RepID=UPI00383A792C
MTVNRKIGTACAVLVATAVLLSLLADQPRQTSVLAESPTSLRLLRSTCRTERPILGEAVCRAVARADTQRFLSGTAGPDEYISLGDLPFIPASFDQEAVSSSFEEEEP